MQFDWAAALYVLTQCEAIMRLMMATLGVPGRKSGAVEELTIFSVVQDVFVELQLTVS